MLRLGRELDVTCNVETWVSAALMDKNTCMDGFEGGIIDKGMKVAVRQR